MACVRTRTRTPRSRLCARPGPSDDGAPARLALAIRARPCGPGGAGRSRSTPTHGGGSGYARWSFTAGTGARVRPPCRFVRVRWCMLICFARKRHFALHASIHIAVFLWSKHCNHYIPFKALYCRVVGYLKLPLTNHNNGQIRDAGTRYEQM